MARRGGVRGGGRRDRVAARSLGRRRLPRGARGEGRRARRDPRRRTRAAGGRCRAPRVRLVPRGAALGRGAGRRGRAARPPRRARGGAPPVSERRRRLGVSPLSLALVALAGSWPIVSSRADTPAPSAVPPPEDGE